MRTIAIIDDNSSFAEILCYELVRRGYSAQRAHTGADGLALVARESPGLVFLDLRLPDMSGMEVLSRIKRCSPDIQVVIVTAHPQLSTALQAIKNHVVDYLCKPFAFAELDGVLDRAFREGPAPAAPARSEPRRDDGAIEMVGPSEAS